MPAATAPPTPCVPSQAPRSGGRQKCLFKTASAARPWQLKQVSSVETVPSLLPGPAPLPRLTPRGCHMLPWSPSFLVPRSPGSQRPSLAPSRRRRWAEAPAEVRRPLPQPLALVPTPGRPIRWASQHRPQPPWGEGRAEPPGVPPAPGWRWPLPAGPPGELAPWGVARLLSRPALCFRGHSERRLSLSDHSPSRLHPGKRGATFWLLSPPKARSPFSPGVSG